MKREFDFCNKHIHQHVVGNGIDLDLLIWAGKEIPESFPPFGQEPPLPEEWEGPLIQGDRLSRVSTEKFSAFSDPHKKNRFEYFICYKGSYLKGFPEGRFLFWPLGSELDSEQKKVLHTFEKLCWRLKRLSVFHKASGVWVLKPYTQEWDSYVTSRDAHLGKLVQQNREYAKKHLAGT